MKEFGTSGTLPIQGSGCGIRPDLTQMSSDTAFDFSQAHQLIAPPTSQSATPPEQTTPPQPQACPPLSAAPASKAD